MYKIIKEKKFDIIYVEQENIKVWFMDYGATIKQIQTPNAKGVFEDILLEYEHLDDYINNSIYLNATIGPIAGRVRHGLIDLTNRQIELNKNQDNQHTLHSGDLALSFVRFNYDIDEKERKTVIKMNYQQSIEDIKYHLLVTYTVSNASISIDYQANANHDFVFSLTNHAYFNLSGNASKNIKNHIVKINTKQRHALDDNQLATGELRSEPIYDFREPTSLKHRLKKLENHPYQGYDDIYHFHKDKLLTLMASVKSPYSHRQLDIFSTYDHMVFYTHNNTNDLPLKHLGKHPMHYGLCFECQKAPFGYNRDAYLKKEHIYHESIIFNFSTYL